MLNKYGYKISHIDKMNAVEISEKILSLSQSEAQQERIVNDMIRHMVDMDIEAFESALTSYILARGIERTIVQIIFPFMEKIGVLWVTNHINPAQEHLVTNIIKRKLLVGIDGASAPFKVQKSVLLFLPEGEYHELGLLFMYFMLKNDIEYVVKLKKPDYLYTHLTTVGQNFNFNKFLLTIGKKFSQMPVIISGSITHTIEKKIHPPIIFKKSFAEAMEFVSTLK